MRSPSVWFAEANEVGLGAELELAAIRSALQRIDEFREGVALALNVSPATALDPRFCELLLGVAERIVIEITEHAQVDDYDALAAALAPLRERRRATRDRRRRRRLREPPAHPSPCARHRETRPEPDAGDLARSGSAGARRSLVGFAGGVGARIVAEGISSDEDLTLLRALGVNYGQGFYLARPSALLN